MPTTVQDRQAAILEGLESKMAAIAEGLESIKRQNEEKQKSIEALRKQHDAIKYAMTENQKRAI
jgi:hypothetical protein